jgi:hypothetical protein
MSLDAKDAAQLDKLYCIHISTLCDEIGGAINESFRYTDEEQVQQYEMTARWIAEESTDTGSPPDLLYFIHVSEKSMD